jgi:predicted AlkP superfamily pyrophosphatase or phosphodiesterase
MMTTRILIFIISICSLLASNSFAQNVIQQIVPNRSNDSSHFNKPYIIYISADGFRADFADKYNAENLKKFRGGGVEAVSMRPSFPTVTFSNHYTLATGMYPSHHGLVDNSFYDPKRKEMYVRSNPNILSDSSWYEGVPIWTLAEQHKMLSATFYWVGSETAIQGVRPTYWYNFSNNVPIDDRLKAVENWLALPEAKRPHIISLYFPEVDVAGHFFGPEHENVGKAVKFIDSCVNQLVQIAKKSGLDINFVFLSDHGMTSIDKNSALSLPELVNNDQFIVPPGDAIIHIYAKNPDDVKPTYKSLKKSADGYQVYLPKKTPRRWHYRPKNNPDGRIGDILLIPHHSKIFNLTGRPTTVGKHGFDNNMPDMQATFYAWGPAFKSGIKVNAFDNVHVYPVLAKILGLTYTHKIDGDLKTLEHILK